ncbi:hypothetical protein B0H17DRAFT_945506 [Mycena rosella]|uniref:D-arabinono-1,4-lactone oxidase C-terminal domain-containing protein n=1 Tax=Mycena rosella TaxID=1033263 RepID=A0AAD7D496_MYCRO|nr:hypothetical protein B0H17DRAFT_945506 [Mycena rosella]
MTCLRNEQPELFIATLCGLGCTVIILTVQLEVEHVFRLKDVQSSRTSDNIVDNLAEFVHSVEHVRFWWIAATHTVKCSMVNRTHEVWSNSSSLWASQIMNTLTGRFVAWLSSGNVTLIDDSHTIFNYPQYTTEWAIPFQNVPKRSLRVSK